MPSATESGPSIDTPPFLPPGGVVRRVNCERALLLDGPRALSFSSYVRDMIEGRRRALAIRRILAGLRGTLPLLPSVARDLPRARAGAGRTGGLTSGSRTPDGRDAWPSC